MSTYTQILYQIVYSTKNRRPTMIKPGRTRLFEFMYGILKKKNCHLYRLNGVEDHLHIVTHLHPSAALAFLVKDLKLASSDFIKETGIFPEFTNWQIGYSAFTYHIESKQHLINYVKRQEEHHKKESYLKELRGLYKEHQIEFDEKYLD